MSDAKYSSILNWIPQAAPPQSPRLESVLLEIRLEQSITDSAHDADDLPARTDCDTYHCAQEQYAMLDDTRRARPDAWSFCHKVTMRHLDAKAELRYQMKMSALRDDNDALAEVTPNALIKLAAW